MVPRTRPEIDCSARDTRPILLHTERMATYLSSSPQPDKIFRNQEDRDVQALIAKEERIGKEKMHLRREKQRQKQSDATTEMALETTASSPQHPRTPPAVYNGPCVICVEPDLQSREKLQALQYLLQRALPPWARRAASLYSPTGSTAESPPHRVPRSHSSRDFRPVVPIGAFPNVAAAIPVARRLRQQWTPLTFEVTDLHLLSTGGSRRNGPWGCDALVALGELDDNDDDDDTHATTDMVQMVCALGEPGGFFQNTTNVIPATHAAAAADLERWLDGGGAEEEEDDDNGTVVVLGRTQLFTGAMRQYVGMPAPRLSWEVAPRLWHAES